MSRLEGRGGSLLRWLPLYATGLVLAASFATIAKLAEWGGLTTALVGCGGAAFYVVAVFVPWIVKDADAVRIVKGVGASAERNPPTATFAAYERAIKDSLLPRFSATEGIVAMWEIVPEADVEVAPVTSSDIPDVTPTASRVAIEA